MAPSGYSKGVVLAGMGESMNTQPQSLDLDAFERRLKQLYTDWQSLVRECHACQSVAPLNWQFCATCGTRLATACPSCGSPLPPAGSQFCGHCGIRIPTNV